MLRSVPLAAEVQFVPLLFRTLPLVPGGRSVVNASLALVETQFVPSLVRSFPVVLGAGNSGDCEIQFVPSLVKSFPAVLGVGNSR